METQSKPSSNLIVVVAWLVVGLPAAWGVEQTIKTSMRLFQTPAIAATTAPSTAPAAR